jgi:hypothetical protein
MSNLLPDNYAMSLIHRGLKLLLILGCVTACSRSGSPHADRGDQGVGDYAAVQAQLRQQDQDIAAAYSEEHAVDLPANAGDVFERHLVAVGGREAFDTIQTMVLRFAAQNSDGTFAELVRYHKRPLHFRQEISISPRAAVSDGERLWWASTEGWRVAEDETGYLPLISIDNHLIDPDAVGITHAYDGVTAVDGTPGFLVRRVWPHGSEQHLFFSANTGLLTAVRSESPLTANSWFSYWDYRDVGGIRIPFVHIRSVGETGPPHGLVLQSVEINLPLPDSLFIPPEER